LSNLTKIFVICLVLVSLLLTSAAVTFVNRSDNAAETIARLTTTVQAQQSQLNAAQATLAAATSSEAFVRSDAQNKVIEAGKSSLEIQQKLADRDQQLASLKNQNALQSADLAKLAEATKAATEMTSKLQETVATLRAQGDEANKKVADLNAAVSQLTNQLEITERERRYVAEQLVELQGSYKKAVGVIKDAGITPTLASAAPVGVKSGAPAINGAIRELRSIANVPYATVSVGTADGVVKGMEFKIIDPVRGDFLGILTIDSVQPNESIGKLAGPRVSDIAVGSAAKTKL
jgi:septal ring factor EnvC (AmiA/AmiB activator)